MGVIRTDSYFDETAHLKIIDDFYNEYMADKLEEMVGLTLFGENSKKVRNSTHMVSSGLTGVKLVNENADYPEAEGDDSLTLTLTKHKFGADVIITEEAKLFDEYDHIKDRIESIVDDGMDKLDACLAEVFLNGFDTTTYTDPMGLAVNPMGQESRALFNKVEGTIISYEGHDHPTLSNSSVSGLRVQTAKHINSLGQSKPIKVDSLLVGPALVDRANRIVSSEKLTNNNDVNPNKGKFKVIEWDRLARPDGTTDNYWFALNRKRAKKQLKFQWARMPKLKGPEKISRDSNDRHNFSMIYSYGFLNLPYVYGSKGTYKVEDEPVITKAVS